MQKKKKLTKRREKNKTKQKHTHTQRRNKQQTSKPALKQNSSLAFPIFLKNKIHSIIHYYDYYNLPNIFELQLV